MAEEELVDEISVGAPAKKKSKLISILIYAAIFLVGIIIMVLISNVVFNIRNGKVRVVEQEIWAPATEAKTAPLKTFAIPSLQINLSDPTGNSAAFAKVTMALAYQDLAAVSEGDDGGHGGGAVVSPIASELEQRSFEIRDKLINIISAKSYEDLDTPDKQVMLKQEIMNQVNSILIHGVIQDVYITDFNLVKTRY